MTTLRGLHAVAFLTALASVASAQESKPAALSITLPTTQSPASTSSLSTWLRTVGESIRLPDESAGRADRNETVLEAVRRELTSAHPGETQTLGQIELLSLIGGVVRRINDARYRHAVADARRRVARELADFCVDHECIPPESSAPSPPAEGVFLPAVASGTTAGRPRPAN